MKSVTPFVLPVVVTLFLGSGDAEKTPSAKERVRWTTSRITGSPEPPLPYRFERAFPKLTFKNPLLLRSCPGTERLFVGEQAGKLLSFPNEQNVAKADLFLDLTTELNSWDKAKVKGVGALYGLAFHPQFQKNRYCYVCYVLDSKAGPPLPDGSRVSRFRVTETEPPRIDPRSEKVLITWLAGGHNGGDMHFGPDGFLYISTGDAADPNPPDRLDTGQDISDLLSSILRIDVDRDEGGKPYAVPKDNPFLQTPGARPEIWSYGFRNPWRMSFDRGTGDLWVGDVGWELWEMVYRVRRGGNYGWSVMEGRQQVRPEAKRGPTPILPPALDFPHTEAASITGGYVYRGKRYPDLVGTYLCGDWMTRKVWGTRFESDDRIRSHRELAQGPGRVVAFGETNAGELFVVYHDEAGSIQQLVPNPASAENRPPFPTKLSETGLFSSVKEHEPAPGVLPFSINAEQWMDDASAERLVALPGTSAVKMYDRPIPVPGTAFFSGRVFFPKDGVLARTVSMEMERGNAQSRRRLETQVLHFDGEDWHGYTYQWNDEQTDATLVPAAGADRLLEIHDPEAPGGRRKQNWHLFSRAECVQCHNGWAGYTLSFTQAQLDRPHGDADQLATLQALGMITPMKAGKAANGDAKPFRLTNPYEPRGDLAVRARSYLHVNCAHCHQFGAGGTADLELRADTALDKMKIVGVRPVQGTFEIYGAQIVSPSDPYRSVLFYRMAKLGRGRMPHIGSEFVDERGLRLIHDWIGALPAKGAAAVVRKEDAALVEKLCAGGVTPTECKETLDGLLASTDGALRLADALGCRRVGDPIRSQALAAALARADPQIRDLFERFIPDDQRVKRLGSAVKPEQLLALKGDAARGKDLFFKSAGLQCVNCHRVGGVGSTLGPDLTSVGKQYTRAQILESILEPSKRIDPKYVTYLAETADGRVYTGLLAQKSEEEIVLKTVGDKEVRLRGKDVQTLVPQKNSLMPELLLRDLTAEQAADLLEFLASLK